MLEKTLNYVSTYLSLVRSSLVYDSIQLPINREVGLSSKALILLSLANLLSHVCIMEMHPTRVHVLKRVRTELK